MLGAGPGERDVLASQLNQLDISYKNRKTVPSKEGTVFLFAQDKKSIELTNIG
jgi:hypothetical protein